MNTPQACTSNARAARTPSRSPASKDCSIRPAPPNIGPRDHSHPRHGPVFEGAAIGLGLLVGLALPVPAFAAWPTNPAENVQVIGSLCYAEQIRIVTDGVGGAIITWQDCRYGPSDIYAQHVRSDGVVDPAWPAHGLVVSASPYYQQNPAIISDGLGGAIIAWDDSRAFGQFAVYAQHVLASGEIDPGWPVDGLAVRVTPGLYIPSLPAMVSDGTGGAILCFADIVDGHWEMFAQHLLASGNLDPVWPPGGRSLGTAERLETSSAPRASVISDGLGGGIITWTDRGSGEDLDLLAQRVRAIGTIDPSWPASGRALSTTTGSPYQPEIETDGMGGAIVVWTEYQGSADLFAMHILADGELDSRWPVNGRLLYGAPGSQYLHKLVTDGTGGAIVCWTDERDGYEDSDVYAGHLLASGAIDPSWPLDGLPIGALAGRQGASTIESDGAGGAIVSWVDGRSIEPGVYAQHVPVNGSIGGTWPSSGRAVCTADGPKNKLVSTADGSGGVLLAWYDSRSSGAGIYAQRVDSYGLLGPPPVGVPTGAPTLLRLAASPNPTVSGRATVTFSLPREGPARLELADVRGRVVAVRDVERLPAGRHMLDLGMSQKLTAGVYLVRLTQEGLQCTTRLVVLD